MVSLALTVHWSVSLVMVTAAQLTMIGIGPALGLPSLLVVAEAVLLTVPQVAAVVGEVMWTWTAAVGAGCNGQKLTLLAAIVQMPASFWTTILQLSPALVGTAPEPI